eukprot:CAMPEP_0198220450 /NCGR_PEP_ID=MMETSP1445-20131203/79091_1 /TAXON_ID=36898 /ORGANISM="Pyramimonas sp., Strain CCMP2087" /LENGTH=238 /DNA_ID=CAMNT_0043898227 /DNA_START=252 /DNA_END=965 /DNA_ORIENTATION=+
MMPSKVNGPRRVTSRLSSTSTLVTRASTDKSDRKKKRTPKKTPRVKFSSKKADANVEGLHALMMADSEEEDIDVLRRIYAMETSVLITASIEEVPDGAADDAGVSGWLSLPLLGRKRSTRLVGYAHAITDNALVATVLDVRVAREFRDAGVGRKLMSRLVKDIMKRDVFDIGVVALKTQTQFFEKCWFGPDPEGATMMRFNPEKVIEEDRPCPYEDPKHYLRVETLEQMLEDYEIVNW